MASLRSPRIRLEKKESSHALQLLNLPCDSLLAGFRRLAPASKAFYFEDECWLALCCMTPLTRRS
jgi:hypothetical protein